MKVNEILKEGKLRATWSKDRVAGLTKSQIKTLIKNATQANDKDVLDMIAKVELEQGSKKAALKSTLKSMSKEEKQKQAMLEPIDSDLSASEIEKIIAKSDGPIGAEIGDITGRKNFIYKTSTGDEVAAMKCRAYVRISLDDLGYDEQTIETMYNGERYVDEAMYFVIYRNPAKPKQLLGYVTA